MDTPGEQQSWPFRFAPAYRLAALPFGITPWTSGVWLRGRELGVRFGPWRLRTSVDNLSGASRTGGFAFHRTAGPAHLSFTDRGVTFATNGDDAVCMTFHRPVPAIAPGGRLPHPGATVTVADPAGFLLRLAELGVPASP